MKKTTTWVTAVATAILATLASLGLSTPAFAAPEAQPPIATTGNYNWVSTSADGTIAATYSGASGMTVYNSSTKTAVSYSAATLGLINAGEAVVSPDGSEIYILGDNPQRVVVLDVGSGTITQTITLPFAGWIGAVTPDGSALLVYAKTAKQILKIDLSTYAPVGSPLVMAADYPYQMCITSDSSTLYSPGYDQDYTSVIDVSSLTLTTQLPDTSGPYTCALGADDTLYIGDYDSGAIRKYAADGSSITSANGLVDEMFGIGLTCNSVIVGDYQNAGFKLLDRTSLAQTGTLNSVNYTYMMAVNHAATITWVGAYAAATGLQQVTDTNCALANTGVDSSTIGTSVAVSAGLLAAGAIALVMVRRRRNG
ncbi:MAG: hypothetical protein F2808_03740 [Actinobacteria bacterium]|uniref:Unannotated protein n=1 Tax=freshwater metagenome TaxID=449393 RepID=A0A6J7FYP8_9ZZZZ|nr:hypothetical protein [Actinomycetota bacterium]